MEFDMWNENNYLKFVEYLISLENIKYKDFNSKLIPNIKKEKIIGIKIPILRKIAKEILKTDFFDFLKYIKNNYFEETMIEGLIIANIDNKEIFEKHVKSYINKIDNWATCDTFCNSIKIINKNKDYFFNFFKDFLNSNDEYTIRVALVVFLNYYIEEKYISEILSLIDNLKSEYYYVNMAVAWLISMMYVKYPKIILKYLKSNNLDDFVHNKSIQKIIESNRVSIDDKNNLRKLKR